MTTLAHRIPTPESFGAPFLFYSYNRDGRINYVSDSIEELLGYSANRVLGAHYSVFLIPDDDLNRDTPAYDEACFVDGKRQQYLRAVLDDQGRRRVLMLQTNGRANESGEIVCCHCMAIDVTDAYVNYREQTQKLQRLEQITSQMTSREEQVLRLVMDGRLNKQIAKQLNVSVRTIESTRSRLVTRLNASHLGEVAAIQTEAQLLKQSLALTNTLFATCSNGQPYQPSSEPTSQPSSQSSRKTTSKRSTKAVTCSTNNQHETKFRHTNNHAQRQSILASGGNLMPTRSAEPTRSAKPTTSTTPCGNDSHHEP